MGGPGVALQNRRDLQKMISTARYHFEATSPFVVVPVVAVCSPSDEWRDKNHAGSHEESSSLTDESTASGAG